MASNGEQRAGSAAAASAMVWASAVSRARAAQSFESMLAPAVMGDTVDRKLCVPAFRRVCLCQSRHRCCAAQGCQRSSSKIRSRTASQIAGATRAKSYCGCAKPSVERSDPRRRRRRFHTRQACDELHAALHAEHGITVVDSASVSVASHRAPCAAHAAAEPPGSRTRMWW